MFSEEDPFATVLGIAAKQTTRRANRQIRNASRFATALTLFYECLGSTAFSALAVMTFRPSCRRSFRRASSLSLRDSDFAARLGDFSLPPAQKAGNNKNKENDKDSGKNKTNKTNTNNKNTKNDENKGDGKRDKRAMDFC